MRRILFPTIILGMTSLANVALAQNYVQPQNYEGPGIIVNLDVLGAPASSGIYSSQPPVQPPMPMPAHIAPRPTTVPPIVLRPPVAPAQQHAPVTASTQVPQKQDILTPVPFSARDVATLAPPPPPVAAVTKMPVQKEEKAVHATAPAVPANPARQLLAQAREEALWDDEHKTVEKAVAETPVAKKREEIIFDAPAVTAGNTAQKIKKEETAQLVPSAPVEALEAPAAGNASAVVQKPVQEYAPALPSPLAHTEMATQETKMASLTPAAKPEIVSDASPAAQSQASEAVRIDDFEAYRLVFDANAQDIKPVEQKILDKIIAYMKNDNAVRLQIRAYANGTPDTTAQARRVSLARALAVRTYLLDKGITAPRLDVRALGIGSTAMGDSVNRASIPADRADLVLIR